jgi:hypothetical protein
LIKKHHEPCILFLEDAFSASDGERLKNAGYLGVERFADHFRDDKTKHAAQGVKDPRIIRLCESKGWLLVTTDSSMHKTHTELIKTTHVTILATAHNSAGNMEPWVNALIRAKAKVERHFKKYERPWFATFTRSGDIHITTIGPDKACRRNRQKEMETTTAKSAKKAS